MSGTLLAIAGGACLGALTTWLALRHRRKPGSGGDGGSHSTTTRRANAMLFEQIAAVLPNAFYLYDFDEKRSVWFNRRLTDDLGYPEEEVEEWDDEGARLIHPDDQAYVFGRWHEVGDEPIEGEWRVRARDGTWRWVHGIDVVYRRHPDGSVKQIVGSVMDVTPMKEAQLELKKQRDELNLILRSTTDLVFYLQPEARLVWHGHVPGVRLSDLPVSRSAMLERVHPDDLAHAMAVRQQVLDGLPAFELEIRMRLFGDDYRWVRITGHSSLAAADSPETFVGAITDIHDRRQAENQLRQEHRLLEGVTRTSVAAITVLDPTGRILFANESAERILGLTVSDLTKRTYDSPEWRHTDVDGGPWPDEKQPFTVVMKTRRPVTDIRHAIVWPDGGRRVLSINGEPILDDHGEVTHLVFSIQDISHQMETDKALRSANARLAGIIDNAMDAMITVNEQEDILMFNPAASRVFGYLPEEVLGEPLGMLMPERSREKHHRLVHEFGDDDGVTQRMVGHYRTVFGLRKDGTEFPIEASISKMHDASGQMLYTAIVRDLTERQQAESERDRLERQLEHARKMEAVGQLAGGVAHDFNNLLTATINNVFLLRRQAGDNEQMLEYLDQIDYASNRAAALTRQLLTFSRRDLSQPAKFDLVDVVRSLEPLLTRVVPESIKLSTRLPDVKMTIEADRSQVEQVVMNLVVNATDAMPEGGELDIVVTPASHDDSAGSAITRFVALSVIDNGHGMEDGVKERMFEPFFTTKPVGKGTGLGLATVFGAVERADGRIDVTSTPGQGTTITVSFPLAADDPEPQRIEIPALAPSGAGSILLCEDEEPVRIAMTNLLARQGYEVHPFATPGEAIAAVRQSTRPADLVITDVVMPGMSGPALRDVIREAWPLVPVLFVTGYASTPDGVTPDETIPKPFEPTRLLQRVREEMLANRRDSPNERPPADDQVIGGTEGPPNGTD